MRYIPWDIPVRTSMRTRTLFSSIGVLRLMFCFACQRMRALAASSQILLVDEPERGLDNEALAAWQP